MLMRISRCLLPALSCALCLLFLRPETLQAQRLGEADVALMCSRMQALIAAGYPDTADIRRWMRSLRPDGGWDGIDYLNTGISYWPPSEHLNRVSGMAAAYRNPGSPLHGRSDLDSALHHALDYWLRHNYTSQNWWTNDIGVPNTLGDLFILLRGETSETELLQALNQMRGSYITQTGQNRVWRAEIQLKIGLITYGRGRTNLLDGPATRIQEAADILRSELVVRMEEGIQPDWSYHQHGVQQQFGNYGLSFAATQARWAWVLGGTPYAYTPEKIGILRDYVLRGLSRVVYHGVMDISGCGRQLFPAAPEGKGRAVMGILGMMEKADSAHREVYSSYRARLLGADTASLRLAENVYYWRSALFVHREPAYYFSVRMCSEDIQRTESINGENVLGSYLADGASYLYRTGKEYADIFPVWDWHRVPGVTAPAAGPLPSISRPYNGDAFAGGVSDTVAGAAGFLYARDGMRAHKAWLFFPSGVVCLGAGIRSTDTGDILTTINQCRAGGPAVAGSGRHTSTLGPGKALSGASLSWIYQDHTGYLLLSPAKVHVDETRQQGAWDRVNHKGSDRPVAQDIFNLWIDHGAAPQDAGYAYMVLPGAARATLARTAAHPPVRILRNDTTVQAAEDIRTGRILAVFYGAGSVSSAKKTVLAADAPCLVIVQPGKDGLAVSVSAPPGMSGRVTLRFSGHYTGENTRYAPDGTSAVEINLPEKAASGSSVKRVLRAG